MNLVTTFRPRCTLVLVTLLLVAPRAQAEPVTHQFIGQLTTITNGSGGLLDLTGLFSLGQELTLTYTIERVTQPTEHDPYTSAYTDGISELTFSIDTWSGAGTPAFSFITVTNGAPSPGNPAILYDQYSGQVQGGITAPEIGGSTLQSLTWTLDDVQGTVFGSTALPREFPELSVFEGKTATIQFFDFTQLKSGYVMATLANVATPAAAATWGGVKALYR